MDDTLCFDQHLAPGVALKDFQTVGVAYALVTRRTFIADEMGLGKTIQALCALEAAATWPAIIVCPASLKLNWRREAERFLTGRSVAVLSGRKADPAQIAGADLIVVNYDIVAAWTPLLADLGPRALVLDESHYAKSKAAQRTQALLQLSQAVDPEGLVLCLTGTPLLNRPSELITQLEILGRLEDVAPRPSRGRTDLRSWEFAFKFRFCGPEQNDHGWDFKGATNLAELNTRLRSTCYVRRQRRDVLNRNDTVRLQVPLDLNGELADYRKAEEDFIAWLYENEGASAARKALQAEALTKLGRLRRMAGTAKVPAAIEWIDNFLDSNPDDSLVVFAHHVEVQRKLALHYGCPTILGGQDQASVEAGKEAFQAGEHRVIVCSLSAAREGHTLTRAHNVLFIEEPWHPGAQQQAEDRINRIGQEADNVFSWHLLAADTVDEDVYGLIESKREVFKAAAEGGEFAAGFAPEEANVANEVLDSYRRRARA